MKNETYKINYFRTQFVRGKKKKLLINKQSKIFLGNYEHQIE